MASSWYTYMGQGGNPLLPSSYRRFTLPLVPTCTNGCTVCAVFLIGETATTPSTSFTPNIINYITNGLALQTAQPDSDPFVRFKNC